jgi:PAS domain S-box-containing protein
MTERLNSGIARYLVAPLAVALAVGITLLGWPVLKVTPFALLYAAISLTAWYAGRWPALLATALAVVAGNYFFLEPYSTLSVSPDNISRLLAFTSLAVLISYIATAQRRAEETIRRTETALSDTLNAINDIFFALDCESRITYANRRFKELFHRSTEGLKGQVLWDAFPALRGSIFQQQYEKATATGEPVHFEALGTLSNRWFEMHAYPGVDGLSVFGTDITEQKHIAAERKLLEERFRIMADNAPVLIWMSGPDQRCTWFNKRWLEFRGHAMEQELGTGWTEGVHPNDQAQCMVASTMAFQEHTPFSREYRLRRYDGEYRWILDEGVPLYGPGGEFTGYLGSCMDITEIKKAQEENRLLLESERAARTEAERVSRMKDEFLATLSHELRTPLNAILGWAQLLRGEGIEPEMQQQGLETIQRNSRIQAQLIEDLLDMSRIISGKIRLDVQRVDVAAAVEAAVEVVRPAAEAKEIRLQVVLDPIGVTVTGDPNRLQQIVWNILSNAVKFTPKGGRVQVSLARVNSHVEITISDTGQGISPEFLPHVFERFRQADSSSTRRHGGLGLGLGIVRHLVELHGGTVRATSPGEGQGATFIVTLPLSAVHDADSGMVRVHPTAEVTLHEFRPPSLTDLQVLVVDDEPDSRELVKRVLEECEAVVVTADSAAAALAQIQRQKPDVLISDIGMPVEDGYSLIRQVRALPPESGGEIPAVALTAFARSEDRRRALLAGFQMHLPKPVEPSELVAVVASVAGRRRRPERREA